MVIEWADKIADALPAERLEISLTQTVAADSREIVLTPYGKRAEKLAGSV